MNPFRFNRELKLDPSLYISHDTVCPVCHKTFDVYTQDWYWQHDKKLVCSYTCMRVLERQDEENTKNKRTYTSTGRRQTSAERMRNEVQIPKNMTDDERELLIVKMRKEHYSYDAIEEAVGYSTRVIKSVLQRYGIKEARPVTEEEVRGYARLRNTGMSTKDIARRYRRAVSTVRTKLIDYDNQCCTK